MDTETKVVLECLATHYATMLPHSLTYSLYGLILYTRSRGDLENIPEDLGHKEGYNLDRVNSSLGTHTYLHTIIYEH